MKYIPSEESEEINSRTEKNPLMNVAILIVGAAAVYITALIVLGLTGEYLASKVPPRYEGSLFSFMNLKIEQKKWPAGDEIVSNIFKNNSVDEVFKPEIFLSCENTVNAVTLPGRKIIVYKGLLADIKSLNSLYFVIGHEIGHIINRDHLRSIGRALAISIGFFFVNMAGDSNSFLSFNQAIVDRQFSQHQETAADQTSIDFTVKRFKGLARSHEFFDQIVEKDPEPKLIGFLNTHPMTKDRIDKIKSNKHYNLESTKIEPFDPSQIPCP